MTDENKTAPAAEAKKEETPAAPAAAAPEKKDERPQRERRPRRGGRGRKPREPKEFEEAILQIDRVTRVVKGGRRLRFRLTVVIGDKKGRVGFGIGKSGEIMGAIQKAVREAKKAMITVPMDGGTIPHECNSSFKASRVLLFPAPKGKGVIAGGAVRKILELSGVRDVLSKSHGSRNKLNVAMATFDALKSLATEKNPGKKNVKTPEEAAPAEEKAEEKKEAKTPDAKPAAEKKAPAKKPAAKKAAPAAAKKTPAKKPAAKKTDADKK